VFNLDDVLQYGSLPKVYLASSNDLKYEVLIDTLMGFLLMPIKKSVRQQIAKSPKFYFFDNGVQRALCEKLKGLKSFAKVFPEARLICACLAQYPFKLDKGIEILPWKDLLEQV
jgi:hypothetical protein